MGSFSGNPARMYSSISAPSRWTGTRRSMKDKPWSLKFVRGPKACRRRTSSASSLTDSGPSRLAGTDLHLSQGSPKLRAANKEAVVQVLSEGQCIKHDQYGFGIVTDSDTERTSIDFDSVGM